jgi:hypothetical protein
MIKDDGGKHTINTVSGNKQEVGEPRRGGLAASTWA